MSTINNNELIKVLKCIVESLNANYDINMNLHQPSIESLSIIGKSDDEIIDELKNNITAIMLNFVNYKEKFSPLDFQKTINLFRVNEEEFTKFARKISALIPVINYSKQDKEFSELSLVSEAIGIVNEILDLLFHNMIISYCSELVILYNDFVNYSVTISETGFSISSSQTISRFFDIKYKEKDVMYCTIRGAIEDNLNPSRPF